MAALAVTCGVVWLLMPDDPRYQDKRLSEWLRSLDKSPIPLSVDNLGKTVVVDTNHAAAQAIMHIGGEAVPYLVRELRVRDSAAKLWLMDMLRKQSVIRIHFTHSHARHVRALQACAALGSTAKATLPALRDLLDETKVDPVLPRVLAMMGPDALPSIIAGLTNRDSQVKWLMASSLRQIAFNADAAVPTLVSCLKETEDYRTRCEAAMALAHIAKRPDLVLPALTNMLIDSNADIRHFSAQAIEQFRAAAREIK